MTRFSARVYRLLFAAAAAYNIAFGLWAALAPQAFFRLFRLAPPRYPAFFACLGMVDADDLFAAVRAEGIQVL